MQEGVPDEVGNSLPGVHVGADRGAASTGSLSSASRPFISISTLYISPDEMGCRDAGRVLEVSPCRHAHVASVDPLAR